MVMITEWTMKGEEIMSDGGLLLQCIIHFSCLFFERCHVSSSSLERLSSVEIRFMMRSIYDIPLLDIFSSPSSPNNSR
jgi:hypothetical protein